MSGRAPRYPREEFARRGDEIYDREIRGRLEAGNTGKFVAIDIESGVFEIADEELVAADRLRGQYPDAQIWMTRVGSRFLRRFGLGRFSGA